MKKVLSPSLVRLNGTIIERAKLLNDLKCDFIHVDVSLENKYSSFIKWSEFSLKERKFFESKVELHVFTDDTKKLLALKEEIPLLNDDCLILHISEDTVIDKKMTGSILEYLKKIKISFGISLDLNCNNYKILPLIPFIDVLVIMGITVGSQGLPIAKKAIESLDYFKSYFEKNNLSIPLIIDGGINNENIDQISMLVQRIVVGSILFNGNVKEKWLSLNSRIKLHSQINLNLNKLNELGQDLLRIIIQLNLEKDVDNFRILQDKIILQLKQEQIKNIEAIWVKFSEVLLEQKIGKSILELPLVQHEKYSIMKVIEYYVIFTKVNMFDLSVEVICPNSCLIKPAIIAIGGVSGIGKTTIVKTLVETFTDRVIFYPSYTTRSARKGEKQGIDYYYQDPSNMSDYLCNPYFSDFVQARGNWYWVNKFEIVNSILMNPDKLHLFVITQEKELLQKKILFPWMKWVWLESSSEEQIINRMRIRGDNDSSIEKSIEHNLQVNSVANSKLMDLRIYNMDGSFEKTVHTLINYIKDQFHEYFTTNEDLYKSKELTDKISWIKWQQSYSLKQITSGYGAGAVIPFSEQREYEDNAIFRGNSSCKMRI